MNQIIKIGRDKQALNELELCYNSSIKYDDISNEIDKFIEQTLIEIIFFNGKYTASYIISDELINELENRLSCVVIERLSENMIKKLECVYNHEKIETVIVQRCIVAVKNYAITYNSTSVQ